MFQSSIIIREPALNLAKVIFTLKHSVKLRRSLLCGCVAACHGMTCVACCTERDCSRILYSMQTPGIGFPEILGLYLKIHIIFYKGSHRQVNVRSVHCANSCLRTSV